MNKAIEQMFSKVAIRYDLLNHLLSWNRDKKWRQKGIDSLEERKVKRVLDLCTGTGDFGLTYIKKREKGRVLFVDFSDAMLQIARKKTIKKVRDKKRVEFIVADALKLPFPEDTFDVVLCGFGIRNIDRETETLIEVLRVLRGKGELLILEFFRPSNLFSMLFYWIYGMTIIPLFGRIISRQRYAYCYLVRSIWNGMSLREFCLLLETIGYTKVKGRNFSLGISSIVKGTKR